jgi:hypothetical protein
MSEKQFTLEEMQLFANSYTVTRLRDLKQKVLDANAPAGLLNEVNLLIEKSEQLGKPESDEVVAFQVNKKPTKEQEIWAVIVGGLIFFGPMLTPWVYGAYKLFQLF